MKMMNEGNVVMTKSWRDFYNGLSWVLLDLNEPQFLLAWRLWQQRRQQKNGPVNSWARGLLQRMG